MKPETCHSDQLFIEQKHSLSDVYSDGANLGFLHGTWLAEGALLEMKETAIERQEKINPSAERRCCDQVFADASVCTLSMVIVVCMM